MNTTTAVTSKERIVSLDVLRGFALLGILVMNIQAYSMPGSAYINPASYGDLTGINRITWIVSHLLADQKFMSIFSMLFGAGICVFASRAEQRTGRSAGLHYRRTFWLLAFGLMHAYLIWPGDILVPYAVCALWVYLLRNRGPLALLITGVLLMSVSSLFYLWMGTSLEHFPPEAMTEIRSAWEPTSDAIAKDIATWRSGWLDQMPLRAEEALFFETFLLFTIFLWRAGGMMLIGMALYKWGVLSAAKSSAFYRALLIVGVLLGLSISAVGVQQNFSNSWSLEYSMYLGSQFNYWGSAVQALGYVALIMLLVKSGWLAEFQRRLAAVGRTAFSNYILQSLICTTIFYGHGFGLFGSVPRYQQLLIVLAIWLVQLALAPWWLARFRYGPLEWLWRSLTYWQRQPLVPDSRNATR